jgi:hypothetical protein
MFRVQHQVGPADLVAYSPSWQTIGTIDLNDAFGGLSSNGYTALNASAAFSGVSDAASTIRLTFTGICVDDKTYDISIAAAGDSGRVDIDKSLTLAQYRYVTVKAYCNTAPVEPPTGLTVTLTTQYPATSATEVDTGLFTIGEIVAAKRPDSPIGTSAYWDDLRAAAEEIVKCITRRDLASATYTDKGRLVEVRVDGVTRWAWFLKEPTGSAIAFASFTTLTLDDTTVATADVLIEKNRLIFESDGEIVAAYPGGWMRNSIAQAVIRQAIIEVMHILHARGTAAGYTGVAQGGGMSTLSAHEGVYAQVRQMLAPYSAPLTMPYVAEVP